ncbi:uncharacterized protein TRUGW13939_02515 [Talaromyces rugulosus]|uniref:Alpha-L-rhamnosidase six-hairpin glycosidase domain-containing protein n=1 Tax=Talaromyces rugulosus TaxID=121627 RepID=A0A7H8QNH6_TALRU|nr:uncharacterized protein TRUGW13939_02515 [Talaromyces rugulosus]QKX55422.1 hypothetical protein TRUGW13939_02515 [Talaromyces rugulosus]
MLFFKPVIAVLYHFILVSQALASKCWQNTACTGPKEPSFLGPWEANVLSPASRTVSPVSVLDNNHQFLSTYPAKVYLGGNGSLFVFDFGQEVGGIVNVNYTASGEGSLGLAFSESKNFTGYTSDESNGGSGPDGALYVNITSESLENGSYTMPLNKLRGGFRYLSLYTLTDNSTISVEIDTVELEISFQPTWEDLRAYGGYFDSNDQLLNRIWYASAYTVQTNIVPPSTGRVWPAPTEGWSNDAIIGNGTGILVDGAKRDRAVWAGDLGISIPSVLVSIGDADSAKSALDVQYAHQQPYSQKENTGELPEVGPPISFYGSDTYHMTTMIATYDYVLYSNDLKWLRSIWAGYQNAMVYITSKIDDTTGLLNVTGASGWGRSATDEGYSTIGNMLLYRALISGSELANWLDQPSLATSWQELASILKVAVNSPDNNWDPTAGAFKNTATDDSIFPEDGNSMALYFDGANSSYAARISKQLTTNWGPIGAVTPELPGNIVPFVESYEIKGHLAIRETQRALDLMRLSWGWYVSNPYGTESTMIEGYYEDGSFRYANDGYDNAGSYPSHSHAWSSGPVDSLISYVVGMRPTAPGGAQWALAPQFGDLSRAEGGFTTPLGKYSARWILNRSGYTLEYDVPTNSNGILMLPSRSKLPKIEWDGIPQSQGTFNSSTGLTEIYGPGGKHRLSVVFS